MKDDVKLISKVLVLENDPSCLQRIRAFCADNNLVGVRVKPENVLSVLRSNVDLGGIFLAEDFGDSPGAGIGLAREVNGARAELPIFLRRNGSATLEDLPPATRKAISAAFNIEQIEELVKPIGEYIFSVSYPNALVRGISQITKSALESQFKVMNVEVAPPYIVRDRLIYGEIFTLIPIESSWCRGYMMLQTSESALLELVRADRTHIAPEEASDFRNLNGVLGEITNLVWGAFKSRYMSDAAAAAHLSQVPIVINHLHRYISFGSENPQLCFKYTLSDTSKDSVGTLDIYQKFVFNLSWSPEDFSENQTSIEDLVQAGELDLF